MVRRRHADVDDFRMRLTQERGQVGVDPACEAGQLLQTRGTALDALGRAAEDGDDLVLRAVETHGRATPGATIRLAAWHEAPGGGPRTIEAAFGPHEIKTFRLPRDPARPAFEVNLLEDPLQGPGT